MTQKEEQPIKVFVLDVQQRAAYITYIGNHDLDTMYQIMNCNLIDVAIHSIEGQNFDFIVDDEGLLKSPVIPSVFSNNKNMLNVGSIIICNSNDGIFQSLSNEDIKLIQKHIKTMLYSTNDSSPKIGVPVICVD